MLSFVPFTITQASCGRNVCPCEVYVYSVHAALCVSRLAIHSLPDLRVRHHANNLDLVRDLLENAINLTVALDKAELGVLEPELVREGAHEFRRGHEVVPREAGEEVVGDLEVQPAVQEGEVGRAGDVCCCAQLAVREGLAGSEVFCGPAEMGEDELREVTCQLLRGCGIGAPALPGRVMARLRRG